MNIVKFLEQSSNEKIITDLPKMLSEMSDYCDKMIGEGMMGTIISPGIGPIYPIKINNTIINMSVVIKYAKFDQESSFTMETINDKLYICSYKDITVEAILLYYVSKLWFNKKTPHVPFMVGFGKCNPNSNMLIDKIIIEKHGLSDEIAINETGFSTGVLFNGEPEISMTSIATLDDLFRFIDTNRDGDNIILPNKQKCNIVELLDYLSISYLHTHNLLFKSYGIVLCDMHPGNIFLQWQNSESYMGDLNIGNIDNITYKVEDKYFNIKTFGIISKVGDIGSSVLHPRDNLYILGQGVNLKVTYPLVEYFNKQNMFIYTFFYFYRQRSFDLYSQTCAFKMFSDYPYNKLNGGSMKDEFVKDFLEPNEVLTKYFSKYIVKSPNKSENTLVI